MDEVDKSVFKIPGFESAKASDFDVVKEDTAAVAEVIAPKEIVVQKEADVNFYDELTAISEEILECRSKILEAC